MKPGLDGGAPPKRWGRAVRHAIVTQLFAIRSRFVVTSTLLVVLPLAGLAFARFYERELLRSEEEGLVTVSEAVRAQAEASLRTEAPLGLRAEAVNVVASAAAAQLRAQIRVLDATGAVVLDTGPEELRLVTSGRRLLEDVRARASLGSSTLAVADEAATANLTSRPEVAAALAGRSGRKARVQPGIRGMRLFLTAPIRDPQRQVVGVVYVSRSTYPVLVSLYRVRNGLLRVLWISLLISLAAGVFLALTVSRPLRKLTRAAQRIAAGERGVTLDIGGRDELGELARAFDTMARTLDARLGYISELAADISHEFKTPLASIRGAVELLRDGAVEDEPTKIHFLDNVLADADRMSRLVSRLLELSRLEARPEDLATVDLHALLEAIVEDYPERVHLEWNSRVERLQLRPKILESAIRNLIDNALRFSNEDSDVLVHVGDAPPKWLRVSVIDHGEGISEANQSRVWERFFTTSRERGGTGLGLAIVRSAVEAHGGHVGLSSEVGRGTEVWFDLPH